MNVKIISTKPALRSIGYIGARPTSSVAANTGSPKMNGPGKSRGTIKPNTSGAPDPMDANIQKRGRFRLK